MSDPEEKPTPAADSAPPPAGPEPAATDDDIPALFATIHWKSPCDQTATRQKRSPS